MDFENVADKTNDRVSDDPIDLEPKPTVIENAGLPHVDKSLGSWELLTFENQYVYTFQVTDTVQDPLPAKKPKNPVPVKIFTAEYVRKSVLGGFHPYAPLQPHGTADTLHDAYYVKVPNKFLTNNLNDRSVRYSLDEAKVNLKHNEDIYVSLRYLQALAENQLAWNPLQVLDLDKEDRQDFYKRDQEILEEQEKLLNTKQKVVEAAITKMKQLIQEASEADIPTIETPVQVTAVTPEFDFCKRLNKTPIPLNDANGEVRDYGAADDMEEEALRSCLEEIHNLSSCKWWSFNGDKKATQDHFEGCKKLKNFLKAVIPFRTGSGKLCFGCHSPFPAGIKNDDARRGEKNRKALEKMNYFHYGRLQRLWGEYWASPEAHSKPETAKSRGWRARYDSSPLSKPLIIWLLPGARTRFYNTLNNGLVDGYRNTNPASHAREVFDKIISQINEGEKKNMSKKHTKLQLAQENWQPGRDYYLLSEDPFRLYQTYIHKDCVHEYMKSFKDVADTIDAKEAEAKALQANTTMNLDGSGAQQIMAATDKKPDVFESVRQLPFGLGNKYEVQKAEYETKKKTFLGYWPDDPEAVPVKKKDDRDEDDGESEYDSDEDEKKVVVTKTRAQKLTEEDTKPIETKSKATKDKEAEAELKAEKEKEAEAKSTATKKKEVEIKKDMTRSMHVNPINAQKVLKAAGSRKKQVDQKRIMGFSASYFAEEVLKWSWRLHTKNERQMSNGLYIAEWLHLSAYSWGGIKPGTDASAQKSSQTKENLVFGTSEANSCMTRYEKAWQQLFKDEKILRDSLEDDQAEQAKTSMLRVEIDKYGTGEDKRTYLQGELSVVCNTKHGPYLFDEYDEETDRYAWKERDPIEEDSTLAKLAAEFPFIAYNIRYEIRLMGQSKILAPLGKSRGIMTGTDYEPPTILHMKAMFYPFSRRFYHRSEHLLDSALYQHMFMLGALNRFRGEKTFAERLSKAETVFKDRFKTKKLNNYESWKKLTKTDGRAEARRDLDALRQQAPALTDEAAHNLKEAEKQYRKTFISKGKNMVENTSKAGHTLNWPKGNKAGENTGQMIDDDGGANRGTLKKYPGQPKSQSII
ncbi:hypothetical protein FMEXI_1462 [Fusarium mexicanum]|uniref:Uncharacterized protein n=1 Tax=Fusarium mexicanum TaxID=751941 RepID=A0A8H5JKA9_9HYPO|nr:hypothetical protein FMEXI_1462 [Fusarium mexicanum]